MKSIIYYFACFFRRKKASLRVTALLMALCSLLLSMIVLYQDSYDAYWREKYLPFSEAAHGFILTSRCGVEEYLKNNSLIRDFTAYPVVVCGSEEGENESVLPSFFLSGSKIRDGILAAAVNEIPTVRESQVLLFSPICREVYDRLENGTVRITSREELEIAGIERGKTEEWYSVFHVAGLLSERDLIRLWDGETQVVFFKLKDYSEKSMDQFVGGFTDRFSAEEAKLLSQTIGIGADRLFPPMLSFLLFL